MADIQKKLQVNNLYKYVIKNFFSQAGSYVFVLMTLLSFLITSITPYISGQFIDFLIYNLDVKKVITFSIFIMLIGILGIVISYFTNVRSIKIMSNISYELLHELLLNLEHTQLKIIEKLDSAYLTQKLITDVNYVSSFVISSFIAVFLNVIALIGILAVFIYIDIRLIFIVLCLVIPYALIYIKIRKPLHSSYTERKEADSDYFSNIHSQILQIFNIQLSSTFQQSSNYISNAYSDYLPKIISANKLTYLFTSADGMIAIIFQSIMFVFGGISIINKTMTIGEFTMINAYFSLLLKTIKYYINYFKELQDSKVSYQRICNIKNFDKMKNGELTLEEINTIDIDTLSVSFDQKSNVFENINFKFEKGKIYTITGQNGSGKSTLLKTILMLYDDYRGKILFNDLSLNSLNMMEIRDKNFGVVPQKLFASCKSVKDYLTEKKCLNFDNQTTLFSNDINRLLDMQMSLLSGGELRKLYLWIVFSQRKDVIILDEPSVELDLESKTELINYLKKHHESLVMIITHDKDLISISDNSICIENYKN